MDDEMVVHYNFANICSMIADLIVQSIKCNCISGLGYISVLHYIKYLMQNGSLQINTTKEKLHKWK